MRKAEIKRKTNETDIYAEINLDGRGVGKIDTGIGFLDGHHTVEDVGVCLGKVFLQAVGEKRGICRYGFTVLPMDEALILTAVDLSGRAYLGYGLDIRAGKVGDFDTELAEEFFYAFVRSAECTLHVKQLSGSNAHHIIEGAFKSFARSLRRAVATESGFEDEIPSTKGVL